MTDEEIILTYGRTVFAIAMNYVSSRFDADDIYSETFLHFFRKKRHFESEEHRKAYLIRLTINCAKDYLSEVSRHGTVPIEERTTAVDDSDSEERLYLRQVLDQLLPEERNYIYLFYYHGMKSAEIAVLCGTSDDAVRSKLKRIREKIKNTLTH